MLFAPLGRFGEEFGVIMNLFDEENIKNVDKFTNSNWGQFLKVVSVCGVLSMVIAAITMSSETTSEVFRMIIYVVFVGIAIMIFPMLIGLLSGLLKRDQSFAFLVAWVIIAGLFLVGSFA